jgi:hypothetical protein
MIEVLSCFVFYTLTYYFYSSVIPVPASLSQADKIKLRSFFTALTHSTLCLSLSFYSYYSDSGISYTQPTTRFQYVIICVSFIQNTIGYLIYDLVFGFLYKFVDLTMGAHHVCGIVGGFVVLNEVTGGSLMIGNRYTATILFTENTSPLYQMKNVLRLYGMGDSIYCQICEILFGVLFLMIRPVVGWFLVYNIWICQFHFVLLCMSIVVYCLGIVWSYVILVIAKKKALKMEKGRLEMIQKNKVACVAFLVFISVVLPKVVATALGNQFIRVSIGGFNFL